MKAQITKVTQFGTSLVSKSLKAILNLPVFAGFYDRLYLNRIGHVVATRKRVGIPNEIIIETTNRCNANCIMCPRQAMTRELGIMKETLFRSIIDQVAMLGIKRISLHNFGEPLLDPALADRARYAKQKGIPRVAMNTNASLLTEKTSQKILESGMDEIVVSLDGFYPETYERVRRNLRLGQVVENVEQFLTMRKARRLEKPRVCLHLCIVSSNKAEVELFKKKWEGQVDRVSVAYATNRGEMLPDNLIVRPTPNPTVYPCIAPWVNMVVLWDGRVALCCVDFDGSVILGDLTEQELSEVWLGPEMESIRQLALARHLDQIPICSICEMLTDRRIWWTQRFD